MFFVFFVFFVFFGTGLGLLGGLGYFLLRSWLPDRSVVAGRVTAALVPEFSLVRPVC